MTIKLTRLNYISHSTIETAN